MSLRRRGSRDGRLTHALRSSCVPLPHDLFVDDRFILLIICRIIGDIDAFLHPIIGFRNTEVDSLDQEEDKQDQKNQKRKRLVEPHLHQLRGKSPDHAAAGSGDPLLPQIDQHIWKAQPFCGVVLPEIDHIGKQNRQDQRGKHPEFNRPSTVKKQDKSRQDQANGRNKIAPFSEKAFQGKRHNAEKSALVKKAYDHDRRKED